MIKKYSITREALLDIYPTLPAFRNDLTLLGCINAQADSVNFPTKSVYQLTKKREDIPSSFMCSKIGIYEIEDFKSCHSYYNVLLPYYALTVEETEGVYEKIIPVLNKFMLGRYFITTNPSNNSQQHLYLYYPEITISNTLNESHVMKDMVIRLTMTEAGLLTVLEGKRFSFTKQELYYGYSHSHLHTRGDEKEAFNAFCIGDSSSLRKYFYGLKVCDADKFELLLVQIEQFLSWESIEGKPYISISNFFTNNIGAGTTTNISQENIAILAGMMLRRLTPELLFQVDDYTYIVDPGFNEETFLNLERIVTQQAIEEKLLDTAQLYDYDLSTNTFVNANNQWSNRVLPTSVNTQFNQPIRTVFEIKPHLYETNALKPLATTIKRLGIQDQLALYNKVNELLIFSHKLNGQDNISTESENSDNSEIAVTDNSTPQPMPNEQGVVGVAIIQNS